MSNANFGTTVDMLILEAGRLAAKFVKHAYRSALLSCVHLQYNNLDRNTSCLISCSVYHLDTCVHATLQEHQRMFNLFMSFLPFGLQRVIARRVHRKRNIANMTLTLNLLY